ncbi:MAG: MmcQ/YjbR family DNA-binding protein [Ignavibacteriae bacterium]|nr:MAG: MmcQ/YjbR family DNA-binding protein [Ignavibacteriota bacterium]
MTLDHIREYCLKKKFVTEEFPFDEETLVFKVMGKMFLLTNLNPPLSINIKCDPETAIDLRERYAAVLPGYHMNKKHWNTVEIDGTISPKLIFQWIDDSYELVVQSLPKVKREKM